VGLAALLLVGGGRAGAARFDQARAWEHLVRQCSFGPRVSGQPGHAQCLAYLQSTLSQYSRQVRQQELEAPVAGKQVRFVNVLADFPAGPGAEHVLLCAHWDTRPRADRERDPEQRGQPILGANDGASGVAVLLEVARLLAERPCPYHVTIALFDGEDYASGAAEMFAGAKEYARHPWPSRPQWGVLLDMVGDRNLRVLREQYSAAHAAAVVSRLWAAAGRVGAKAFGRGAGYLVMDDHWPLTEAGTPTAVVIDFDYPHWHRLTDIPANCAPESLGEVGRTVEEVLWGKRPTSTS